MKMQGNYFMLPNEVFQLGLSAGELAVYSYLRCCEDRRTHQCWPSYRAIGCAVSMAYNRMKTLLKRAGLPELRFHDLRHTFATHALASGVDAKTLSGILGHTKASFTLDTYAHVTGDMQRQAAQVMDTFMTDIFGKELTPWQSGESPAAAAST